MKKASYFIVLVFSVFFLSACSTTLSGPGSGETERRDNKGPDSGDETDLGPDSGDEIDTSKPGGPDSGDEVDSNEPQGPDSGDEEEVEPQPKSPDSGEEIDPADENDDDDDGEAPTSPDSGEEIDTTDPDQEAWEDQRDEELVGQGSCDMIGDNSVCVTYSGSYWKEMTMKLHCEGSGTFSTKKCPVDMMGGCKSGAGTVNENIIWYYGRGGQPFDAEAIGYSAKACGAVAGSVWVGR